MTVFVPSENLEVYGQIRSFVCSLNFQKVNKKEKPEKKPPDQLPEEEMEQFLKKKEIQNDVLKKIIEKISKESGQTKK